jgi:UDP-3-O-[3-hydroxymyristoyl] glucosamine N-acyltransferase
LVGVGVLVGRGVLVGTSVLVGRSVLVGFGVVLGDALGVTVRVVVGVVEGFASATVNWSMKAMPLLAGWDASAMITEAQDAVIF